LRHESLTEEEQERAALYAIGALCQHDIRALEYHLSGCDLCQNEVAQFQEVVGLLGSASEPMEPPAHLRSALAERIKKEAITTQRRSSTATAPVAGRLPESSTVVAFPDRSGSATRGSRIIVPWAIAAALVIAFASLFVMMQSQRREMLAQLNALDSNNSVLRDSNERLARQLDESNQVTTLLAKGNTKTINLAGQAPAPNASAHVYWDVPGNKWLVSADLPPAPEGKVYQLWFVTPDAKISAGLIKPDRAGHGFVKVDFPSSVSNLAAAAITLEPEGGSAQPTMPIYVLGKS
jgi:anti-sigma-K factor RskA